MFRSLIRSFVIGAISMAGVAISRAQVADWDVWCDDPNAGPSVDYSIEMISEVTGDDTPLLGMAIGFSGSNNYICHAPAPYAMVVRGNYGFHVGSLGTVQSEQDDFMALTYGMPSFPGNSACYTTIDVDALRNHFGSQPWALFFKGASDRYIKCEQNFGNATRATLNIDVLGDAARFQYVIRNTSTVVQQVGLSQGAWIYLLDQNLNRKGGFGFPEPFLAIPGQRTPKLETMWTRADNPAVYPPSLNIDWSQSEPFGWRIETGPSDSTTDPVTEESDATQSDVFFLGNHGEAVSGPGLLGDIEDQGPVAPGNMFPIEHISPGIQQSDITYTANPAYLMRYNQKPVAPNGEITIVQYFRSTWGQSNYAPPYTVVIDAPKVFQFSETGLNQLDPNPAKVRVYVDNIRGFTTAEQEVALQNVRVTLDLNTAAGLTISGGGKIQTKVIPFIASRRMNFVEFDVVADGIASGIQEFVVRVSAPPGPVKTMTAFTDLATTPKMPVVPGSNLVTLPWSFSDSSLDAILGLSQPTQYQAFRWDPVQQGYVLATSAQRGVGTWVVFTDPSIIPLGYVPLSSSPSIPTDMAEGMGSISLVQGWNLIGNPYPYPIPLGDLIGVPAGDPTHTYKWVDLVGAGFVSASMAYWDTTTSPPGYKFISGQDALMQPNTGYWLFVTDLGLTLQFPPVFYEGALVGGTSTAIAKSRAAQTWTQSPTQYRLMVSARTNDEIDDQNFVGRAASAKDAKTLKIFEPPMGPKQNLAVSIGGEKPTDTRLAQSLLTTTGVMKWSVYVKSNKADQITLTWPNMSTLPKNVSFRLTDVATGTSRDMRRTSGYTFTTTEPTTREFTIQAQPGTVSKVVIGNVVVAQPGKARDKSAPFTISYTLSSDATTTVRILGAGGKEIYTATRGRADSVGENTATWALRDNANRAVAPGVYRVEITAETNDGQRVRKIVPINVIR